MNNFTLHIKAYAPIVLRYSMTMVILWFSFAQFIHTDSFTAYVPDSAVAVSHMSATTLVYFNAIFELVFGLMLLFGIKTRWAALLLSLHLFDIMYTVGYGEIGVRDFGLALATLAIAMYGSDILCIDYKNNDVPKLQTVPVPPRKII